MYRVKDNFLLEFLVGVPISPVSLLPTNTTYNRSGNNDETAHLLALNFITSSGLFSPRKLAMTAGVLQIPSNENVAEPYLQDGFHWVPTG